MMSCRTCIVLPQDRGAGDLALRIAGDGRRWPEIVRVNPQKARNRFGGFDFLQDGERLALPTTWPDDPFTTLARMPKVTHSPRPGVRFETGALSNVALPNGWTDDDLKAIMVMANDLGIADPKQLPLVWASETGVSSQAQLNPRTNLQLSSGDPWTPFFAGGLNGSTAPVVRAMGFKTASDWLSAPIKIQLQGIYKQYVNHVRAMGEGFDARAGKLGTTTAALIYAFNFLPAFAVNIRSATAPIVMAGSAYYDQNCVLDTSTSGPVQTKCGAKKGSITLRDFETLTNPGRWPAGWPVQAIVRRLDQMNADPQTVASLGVTGGSVWDAIRGQWESLTGTAPKTDAPAVIAASPRGGTGGASLAALGVTTAGDYWKATGVVVFAAFVLAYSQGWIRR